MRVIRVHYQGKTFYASLIDQQSIQCLNKTLGLEEPIPLTSVAVLPVVMPTKVVCVALNYESHAQEVGKKVPEEPLLFLKPPSSVIGNGQTIVLPSQSSRVDYEGELAVVIGQNCRRVSPEDAGAHIFGYACANDVTARDLQDRDGLFARAKGFDTFAPIGPWIETECEDLNNLPIRTMVNGEVRQEGNTSDMVHKPADLVSFVSSIMTLIPGDVILTGTPPGVGPMQDGDEVRIEIPEVGLLINPVTTEAATEKEPLQ